MRKSRKHGASATVNIHVRDLAQMFNSLDPSPFWDRDLAREAAEFIEDEFSDKRGADRWHLHVYAKERMESAADLRAAVTRYYARMTTATRMRLREQLRIGEIALLAGVGIFTLCISLHGILASAIHVLPVAVDQGLIVLAWIALWRPIEALGYGWVPLYRKLKLYKRLAAMQVTVREDAASGHVLGEPVPGSSPVLWTP
jgi:hypothetical protein